MARNKQRLINYHSSGLTTTFNVADLAYGEIAIRHHADKPEMYTKTGEDTYATFIDSVAVNKAIESASDTINQNLSTLSAATSAFSASVVSNYYTKTEVENKIIGTNNTIESLSGVVETLKGDLNELDGKVDQHAETAEKTYSKKTELEAVSGIVTAFSASVITEIGDAKDDVYASGTSYTDGKVSAAVADLQGKIDAQANNLGALSASVSGHIATYETYTAATDAVLEQIPTNIATAKSEAITSANSYTDGKIKTVNDAIDGVTNRVGTLETNSATKTELSSVSGIVTAFSASVITEIGKAKDEVYASGVSYTNAEVKKLTDDTITPLSEKVNILISGDTGKSVRDIAFDEVKKVVDNAPAEFDTLKEIAEWINDDKTGAAHLTQELSDVKERTGKLESAVSAVSGYMFDIEEELDKQTSNLGALSASVTGHIATYNAYTAATDTVLKQIPTDIATAKGEAIETAKTYTDGKIQKVEGTIDAIDSRVDALEEMTGTTQSAVQTVSVKNTDTNKITSTKTGTNVELNFDEMIIDCGEF